MYMFAFKYKFKKYTFQSKFSFTEKSDTNIEYLGLKRCPLGEVLGAQA